MIGFRQRWHGWLLGASVFALIGLPVPRASYAQDPYGQEAVRYEDPGESTYSREAYVSELEGSASLDDASGGQPLELNQPLETGARVRVFRLSRLELVLAEGSVARLDAGSDLELQASGGGGAGGSVLRLNAGALQLVVDDRDAVRPVRVDTANATAYLDPSGAYLIETDPTASWTRVVVRDGRCELMTPDGSRRLRAGDEAQVDGDERTRVEIGDAGRATGLELWGSRRDDSARRADVRYVDPALRYSASRLADSGTWITIDGDWAWQPRVAAGWRPYWNGRWTYTAGGLTWVSHEPWGWVTSHYGSWDYRDGRGWFWLPGTRYAPAWVYWYWGPTHVGWCPWGYYSRRYRNDWSGFSVGIYGWAGGWDGFLDWSFVPVQYLVSPGLSRYCRRGADLRGELRWDALPRGLITTDTRGARTGNWRRPEDLLRDIGGRAGWTRPDRDLPDVTPFIAHRGDRGGDRGGVPGGRPRDDRGEIGSLDGRPVLKLDGSAGSSRPPANSSRPEPQGRPRGSDSGDGGPVGQPADRTPAGRPPVARPPVAHPTERNDRGTDSGSSAGSQGGGGGSGRYYASPYSGGTPAGARPGTDWRNDAAPRWRSVEPTPDAGSRDSGSRPPYVRTLPAPSGSWRYAPGGAPVERDQGTRWNDRDGSGGGTGDRTPIRRILDNVRQSPGQPSTSSGSSGSSGSAASSGGRDTRPARGDRSDRSDRSDHSDRRQGNASSSRPSSSSSDNGGAPPPPAPGV